MTMNNNINETFNLSRNTDPYLYHAPDKFELRWYIMKYIEKHKNDEVIDLNCIDISEINDLYHFFVEINEKYKLTRIDISEWDVSNIDSMRETFMNCKDLISVGDLSKWKFKKCDDLSCMFKNCTSLEYIGDISKWDVSNIQYATETFANCEKLKNIGDLSSWKIAKNKEACISHMFVNCKSLKNYGDCEYTDPYLGEEKSIFCDMFDNNYNG